MYIVCVYIHIYIFRVENYVKWKIMKNFIWFVSIKHVNNKIKFNVLDPLFDSWKLSESKLQR